MTFQMFEKLYRRVRGTDFSGFFDTFDDNFVGNTTEIWTRARLASQARFQLRERSVSRIESSATPSPPSSSLLRQVFFTCVLLIILVDKLRDWKRVRAVSARTISSLVALSPRVFFFLISGKIWNREVSPRSIVTGRWIGRYTDVYDRRGT